MRSISTRIVVLVFALLIAASAMADPLPEPVTLNVNAIGAQGVVRVNRVPVHYFKEQGPKVNKTSNGTFTNASPTLFLSTSYLLLCTNGDNTAHGRDADYQSQRRGPYDVGEIHRRAAALRSNANAQRRAELYAVPERLAAMGLDQRGCSDGRQERAVESRCRVSASFREKGYREHRRFRTALLRQRAQNAGDAAGGLGRRRRARRRKTSVPQSCGR